MRDFCTLSRLIPKVVDRLSSKHNRTADKMRDELRSGGPRLSAYSTSRFGSLGISVDISASNWRELWDAQINLKRKSIDDVLVAISIMNLCMFITRSSNKRVLFVQLLTFHAERTADPQYLAYVRFNLLNNVFIPS